MSDRITTPFMPSKAAAERTLYHFGLGGVEPGSFYKALIEAIARADWENQAKLALGFPDDVRAVQMAQRGVAGGTAALQALASEP